MPSRMKRSLDRSKPMPAAITKAHQRFLQMALSLPGTELSTSYGTPSVKVRGRIMSRWRTEAEGSLAIRCDFLDRQILPASESRGVLSDGSLSRLSDGSHENPASAPNQAGTPRRRPK